VAEVDALFFAMSAEKRSFPSRAGMELRCFSAAADAREEEDEKTVKVRNGLRPTVTFCPYYKITEACSHRWIGIVHMWLASVETRGMHGNEPSPAFNSTSAGFEETAVVAPQSTRRAVKSL